MAAIRDAAFNALGLVPFHEVLGLFLIPGPAVLLTLARATAGGPCVGIATGLGIAAGDLIHTAMASFRLSAVLMTSAFALDVVKFAGAAYLVYLGARALFEKTSDLHLTAPRLISAPRALRQGMTTEVLNPKTALFFLAFLPQFVHPEHDFIFGQFAVLGLVFVGMSATYITLIALAASQVSRWLSRNKRVRRWQGRVVGTIYITLGLRLALQER